MSDSNLITILHISDFHFSKRNQREQSIVISALEKDIKSLCVGHRKPDLVLFTGDLVYAAGIDSHDEAYDLLVDRVSKATGCSDERIFTIPGNHDVEWNGLEAHRLEHQSWRSILGQPDEMSQLNDLFASGAFDSAISRKFSNYLNLEQYMRNSSLNKERKLCNSFVYVDHIAELNIDLIGFNTAAASTGGHKAFDNDERKLFIPEYAVMEAIKTLQPGSLRIFMTHHPFSMLSEQTARYLESEIIKHGTIHLFGHMHDPQPKSISGLKGRILADQAGALFTARKEFYNGYSLITIDRGEKLSETLFRSYFKDRNEFDEGIDVIENGRWWPSQEARQHFRKIASPINQDIFRNHLATTALQALLECEASTGENDLHTRFVEPPLRRTFIQEVANDEGKMQTEAPVSFSDIINGDSNLILYANPEYGRTTLLQEVRYRLLADASTIGFPRLPVMFDFGDVSNNVENLLRKLRGNSELVPDGTDIEALLKLGHASVLIDDVQFFDRNRMRILREFVARYPKAQYIFSTPFSSAIQCGAHIAPEMPVRFDFVEVREFRRKHMRQLLAKDNRCSNIEEWLDRLQTEFREINLPFTAANGSIFIEILSEKYNFTPINRAVLMEQFVDSTLRKAAIEQSRREIFDYTNKTDLLSHIAAWMAQNDKYILEREEIRTEMKSYIESRGLIVSLDDLLEEFLTARIFIARQDKRISFRYRGVLEYFIAVRMTIDKNFKNWIMSEDQYLRYVNEILYYAGKLRNDSDLVNDISARHTKIFDEAFDNFTEIDLRQLEKILTPRDDSTIDGALQEIARPPLTQEEKDAELETDFPKDKEDRQEVFRPSTGYAKNNPLLSLFLYSGTIKNMELISDIEKRKHLNLLWRSWSLMLIAALRLAPRLAKDRRIRINGALYEIRAPQAMSDATLLKQIALWLPHVHVRLIANTMGSEKLERQLTELASEEKDQPKIYDFFRTGLIANLKMPATPRAIEALAVKLKGNHYLLWSLIVHISELRRLDLIEESHFLTIQGTLAGAIANLRGGTRQARQDEKSKQISRLNKDRLLLSMRRERDSVD